MSLVVLSGENKSVSLAVRKEIRDHTGGVAGELAKVEKATGVGGWTFDFDGDLAAFQEQIDKNYKGRMGEIIAGAYLPQVVYVRDGTLSVGCYASNFWVNIDSVEAYKLENIL